MKGGEHNNNRRSVNAISLFVTCLFLILAVQFSDGGLFATKINKITENLDKAVLGLNDNVTYTNYTDKSQYYSSTEFNSAGMAGLYNLTNLFIDVFAPDDILMRGVFSFNANNELIINKPDISSLLHYYAKLLAVLLFLVLCIALFPLCGLCFCCCRCCGNCGAKPQTSDKKRDTCKKVIQASLLIVCGTALLFCIVCAFGSNQQLQDGIERFPTNMNHSLNDTKTFMDSTNGQVQHLLVTNYQEFATGFNKVMEDSTAIAMEQLMHYSNASAVSEIYQFADNLGRINTTLHSLRTDTNKLRVYASQLNDAIRKVRRDLSNTLQDCKLNSCSEIKAKVDKLQTSIDFNSVPDVSETIRSFSDLDVSSIKKAAEHAKSSLDNISSNINTRLDSGLAAARQQIANTESTINENLESVTKTINQIKSQIDTNAAPVVNTAQNYINDYGKYRYYVGLTISCILLSVTLCIMLGLICGICGKRPDGYSDNCCNKGAGSQFLICAVMIMFLFGFFISIVTLISLTVGVISEKTICDPLRNPDPIDYTVIKLLDDFNLDFGVDIKPSVLLNNCYQNKSIYQTFNLQSKFDLDDIRRQFNVSEQLKQLDIKDAIPEDFQLLSDTQLSTLETLKNFKPDIDVDKFAYELQSNLTNYNLTELSNSLEIIISHLTAPEEESLKTQLQLNLLHLNTYDEKLIIPMKSLATELVITATELNEDLRMNKTSFEEAITDLINEIQEAQVALSLNGTENLRKTAEAFKGVIINLIDGYLDRVSDHIKYEIGQCGPLNLIIHASVTSTCEKVLLPWNGFWFSLFWTIILYIMTIIISVKLANLYQKHKPYDQYVETEYLYDAYADRGDNIPLNSRGGKRGKRKGKKYKRYEERPAVGREVARDFAAGTHPPDGRYADMAPKHWEEFPNGGPPHYQRAPTEYERPPPYYYPGSGGDQ